MKHSDSGPMSDPAALQSLYIDLCTLIVESRTPNEHGYGAGAHCPPLMLLTRHVCDYSKAECQKHETLIRHLLKATVENVFQIEVLLLPECCLETKLNEKIQNKEYIVIERWSMNLNPSNMESNIEIPQLLRAVRSFLHFSQLSAWLSSTKGKSPANVCYWINSQSENLCTTFKQEPEMHVFPLCKIVDDLYGSVKVEFPARTQYIPRIPCCKHPPLGRYFIRELNKDSERNQSVPMETKQHENCIPENELATVNCVPESSAILTSSFKTNVLAGEGKSNRNLNHLNITYPDVTEKTKNLNMPTTFLCSYIDKFSFESGQEPFSSHKRKLDRNLCETSLKVKNAKSENSECLLSISPLDVCNLNQNINKCFVKDSDISKSSKILKSEKHNNVMLNSVQSSLGNPSSSFCNLSRILTHPQNSSIIKHSFEEGLCALPNQSMCCDIYKRTTISKGYSAIPSLPQCTESIPFNEKINILKNMEKVDRNTFPPTITLSNYCFTSAKMSENKYKHCSTALFTSSPKSLLHKEKQGFVNFKNSNSRLEVCKNSMLGKSLCSYESNISENISKEKRRILLKRVVEESCTSRKKVCRVSNRLALENFLPPSSVSQIALNSHVVKNSYVKKYSIPKNVKQLLRASKETLASASLSKQQKLGFKVKKENHMDEIGSSKVFKTLKLHESSKLKMCSNKEETKKAKDHFDEHNSSQAFSENVTFDPFNLSKSGISSLNVLDKTSKDHLIQGSNYLPKETSLTLANSSISEDLKATNKKNSTPKLSYCPNFSKMIPLQSASPSSYSIDSSVPFQSQINVCCFADENLECFPKSTTKFPKGKKLLVNFEESILNGCLPMVKKVKGFHVEIGASGSFFPNHLTIPADISFYELDHRNEGTAPYVAHVSLTNSEFFLPKKGSVQVTLFNPSETVVKIFVLNYDFSSMPPLCHTFVRQKTYYLPVGLNEQPASQKWLRFIVNLRFASSKTGRIFLHKDFKIVVLNKTNDDAASEFSQEPRELCSFLSVPMNPTYSHVDV